MQTVGATLDHTDLIVQAFDEAKGDEIGRW